jgi:hypothetical protein
MVGAPARSEMEVAAVRRGLVVRSRALVRSEMEVVAIGIVLFVVRSRARAGGWSCDDGRIRKEVVF